MGFERKTESKRETKRETIQKTVEAGTIERYEKLGIDPKVRQYQIFGVPGQGLFDVPPDVKHYQYKSPEFKLSPETKENAKDAVALTSALLLGIGFAATILPIQFLRWYDKDFDKGFKFAYEQQFGFGRKGH